MEQRKPEEPRAVSQQIGKIAEDLSALKEKNGVSEPDKNIIEITVPAFAPLDVDKFIEEWFIPAFKIFEKKDFDGTVNGGEPLKFLKTIIYFLLRDERFLKSPLICRGSNFPEPSLSKGLFIIGGYGCGKTSIFETLNRIIERAEREPFIAVKNVDAKLDVLRRYKMRFSFYTANEVKLDFETCPKEDESLFWQRHRGGRNFYDDITAEEVVSKFGKTDIFKQILQNRYNSGATTLVSLNYNEAEPTVEATLNLFGNRYGARVYDRIFEMFNVISLTGKSMRK